METTSLDELKLKYPIDFLSLDTQGSEFQILRGATESLKNIVGIETEVSFRQIYENSDLFSDLCSFLNSLGFEFIRFTTLTEDAPRTLPTLGRLEKLHSFGDALFLRKPISAMAENKKRKLIFAGLAYGQIEYAALCVRELGLSPGGDHDGPVVGWAHFVDRFISIVSTETSLPRGIEGITTAEESAARFELRSEPKKPVWSLKALFVKLPRQMQIAIIRVIHVRQVVDFFFGQPSDLESIYSQAGRTDIAKRLRVSRFRRIFPLF